MITLAVSTEYRRVTDRQTDRQTNGHIATAKSALCIASRDKNWLRASGAMTANGERLCTASYSHFITTAVSTHYANVTDTQLPVHGY